MPIKFLVLGGGIFWFVLGPGGCAFNGREDLSDLCN